ncbi:hypothetical protein CQW23_25134 [Capsicum baccatum]|uniref:Uncharacterized protein n=1 Tax=Capsicum baccatum TaxID=33114 RepID=A0A2G2VK29_CAPBA|nr:hypothetical protein CQW23_25134 [Capsicum baccatum]
MGQDELVQTFEKTCISIDTPTRRSERSTVVNIRKGGTLIKGFNRGLGTFCAGMLAFVFAQFALLAGEYERVVIVVSIFIVAGNRTRDYNVAIFTRLALIALGAGISVLINISICPIWAGEDLHRLVVKNFMDLATSLEGIAKHAHQSHHSPESDSRYLKLSLIF